MKLKVVAFWLVVFTALFVFLQTYSKYHFYFIEQTQLFQFSGEYISDKLLIPGGFTLVLSEFLVQFFILPYAGAAITAGLLLIAGKRNCTPYCAGYKSVSILSYSGRFDYVHPF